MLLKFIDAMYHFLNILQIQGFNRPPFMDSHRLRHTKARSKSTPPHLLQSQITR